MRHFAAHSVAGRVVFTTWGEGLALWRRLTSRVHGSALCIMPDHVHVLAPAGAEVEIRRAMSGYARWLNHREGRTGPLWRPLSDDGEIADRQKLLRSLRYVHLNPCRARLVDDPLAWPLSTHRDLVGLAIRPVAPRRHDIHDFHRYVSSDPSVAVSGSDLPAANPDAVELHDVLAAVGALARRTVEELSVRSTERTLALRAARALTDASAPEIARAFNVVPRTVFMVDPIEPNLAAMIRKVAGDHRFPSIPAEDGPGRRWRPAPSKAP